MSTLTSTSRRGLIVGVATTVLVVGGASYALLRRPNRGRLTVVDGPGTSRVLAAYVAVLRAAETGITVAVLSPVLCADAIALRFADAIIGGGGVRSADDVVLRLSPLPIFIDEPVARPDDVVEHVEKLVSREQGLGMVLVDGLIDEVATGLTSWLARLEVMAHDLDVEVLALIEMDNGSPTS